MTANQLDEHSGYLSDGLKLAAYERSLASHLDGRPGAVLDLGAGSGILGLIAARAGARIVYAVDSGPIIGPAIEVARQSSYADRIVHIRGRSTEIELPEPVEVAVCDQIGGFVHDAGVLEYFADARRRLLVPDGVLVPAGFRLFLAPAECTTVRDEIGVWGSQPSGFDFSAFHELAVNTEYHVDGDHVGLLGASVQVAEIASDDTDPIAGGGTARIDVAGRCDGLVGWFEADMGGGATLTNRPGAPGRMRRWCNLYPIAQGVDVQPGDTVELHVDVRPLLHAVTWNVTIGEAGGSTTTSERHSTLLGQFVAKDDLARAAGATVVATPVGRAVARMLDLADSTRSTDEIMAELQAQDLLEADRPSAERTLRDTLKRFSIPSRDAGMASAESR